MRAPGAPLEISAPALPCPVAGHLEDKKKILGNPCKRDECDDKRGQRLRTQFQYPTLVACLHRMPDHLPARCLFLGCLETRGPCQVVLLPPVHSSFSPLNRTGRPKRKP
jgi:hypothetical protein